MTMGRKVTEGKMPNLIRIKTKKGKVVPHESFLDANGVVTNAVFSVHRLGIGTTCAVVYVNLRGDITRGAAIPKIQNWLQGKNPDAKIEFKFWASVGYRAYGPTPMDIYPS